MNLTKQLVQWQHDLTHLHGEVFLLGSAIVLLILGLFRVPKNVLKGCLVLFLAVLLIHLPSGSGVYFNGWLEFNEWSQNIGKVLIASTMFLVIFPVNDKQNSSYYFIVLVVLLGTLFQMKARHLLLIFLSIEMVSYGSYVLTNFSFNSKAHEAGLKYLLFGGVSSAIMLFGLSILYGTSGSMMLDQLTVSSTYAQMGFYMFLAGALFKVAAAPFHIWLPNVYESAPADTAAFFSIVPTLGGFVLLGNILSEVGHGHEFILAVGIVTLGVGTLGALGQRNIRRLVGYGAIAHAGFLLPLVVLDIPSNLLMTYGSIYAIMNIGIFFTAAHLERNGKFTLESLSGIGLKIPMMSVAMTIILMSLVGLPPFAGFIAKWTVFQSLLDAFLENNDQLVLGYFLGAILATVFSLFYYLRPAYFMFLHRDEEKSAILFSSRMLVLLALLAVTLLVVFFFPTLLKFG